MAREKKIKEKVVDGGSIQFPEPSIVRLKEVDSTVNKNIPLEVTNSEILNALDLEKNSKEPFTEMTKKTIFSKDRAIFLQIHVGNIYSIFGAGIITAANYVSNRAFSDFQTIISNGLAISNGIITSDNIETIALLELNFTHNELDEMNVQEAIAFYSSPIPVSRIKRIFVATENIKNEIITTALSNDGGIIPKNLVKSNFPKNLLFLEFKKPHFELKQTDYTAQLQHYDKVMGTFAFLKNYSFLTANSTNQIAPLPEHYFYIAQAVNKSENFQIMKNDRAVSFYTQLFRLKNGIENPLMKWLFDRVNMERNFTDEDVQEFGFLLFSTSKSQDFIDASKDILLMLTRSLDRKRALTKITTLQDAEKFYLYLFAYLRTYGNLSSESKSISRADVTEFGSQPYGEYVFSLLGYFFGYKTLRNFDDVITINDRTLSSYANEKNRLPIKFSLDTLFEYVLIESIFCNVFKPNSSIDTSFLESDSIKKELVTRPKATLANYEFSFNVVHGKFIYQYKKKSVLDELIEKLSQLPKEIPVISEIGVYCFRNGINRHYPNLGDMFSQQAKIEYVIYFKKEEILAAVKSNRINANELIQRISISLTHKELK